MSKKEKKPFFKRKWVWALIALVVIIAVMPSDEKDKPPQEALKQEESVAPIKTEPAESEEPLTETEQIEVDMREIVSDNYMETTVSQITINPNYGTEDDEDDYVALVYLVWDMKNTRKTTQEMLEMYSEDFAARIGTDIPSVSEFAVFWTVPYHDKTQTAMKFTYDRKDEGMYQVDKWNSFANSSFGR